MAYMIKSAETAARIDQLVKEALKSLNESIRVVQDSESQCDFDEYRRRTAVVFHELHKYILDDLWVNFPHLRPNEADEMFSKRG